jgi:hypothetical protein
MFAQTFPENLTGFPKPGRGEGWHAILRPNRSDPEDLTIREKQRMEENKTWQTLSRKPT